MTEASDRKAEQQVVVVDMTQPKEVRRRRKLKAYAALKGMTVSDVLAEFVDGLIIEH